MKANEAVAQALKDIGVQTVFGLLGDANLFVVDHFVRRCGGEFVEVAHEAGAVLAALGWASVSGRTGVATVTCGPALTNTLTALIEGVKARLPIVLVTGETTSKWKYYLQAVPQRELVAATGAGFEQATLHARIGAELAYAFRRADVERRPIVFNLPPYDLQWQELGDCRPVRFSTHRRAAQAVDSPDLDAAIGMIATAKRPLILAGLGVVKAGARDAVLQLARRLEAPLMTTLRAKDLYRGDPLNLDVMGISSSPAALEVVVASDCIAAFGASLNFITTGDGALMRNKRVVLVNDDPEEIGKHMSPDAAVIGDCGSVAHRMIHWLDEAEVAPSGFASEDGVRTALAAAAAPPVAPAAPGGALQIEAVLQAIEPMIGPDRVLVTGVGRSPGHAWKAFHVAEPRLFVPGHSFGAIGMGLGHAIGAAKAEPGRPTVLVTGDGGFMLGDLVEFHTAVRQQLDIVIVICNDSGYGAEHIQFRDRDMDPAISHIRWPDFAPMAQALGGQGLTVRSLEDLAAVGAAIAGRTRKGPILIDVKVDPDHVPRTY